MKWGEHGVAALGAVSLFGLCPAFVLPISTPYGQNLDKMGIDFGSCGGVGYPKRTSGLAGFCPFGAAMGSPMSASVRWVVRASTVWPHPKSCLC